LIEVQEFFSEAQIQLYNQILNLLETVYAKYGEYVPGNAKSDKTLDVLLLNFTKVVNDCRAIIYLIRGGFFIQAGMIARGTHDACLLMMHISFEGKDATLSEKWLRNGYIKHWDIVKTINYYLKRSGAGNLDIAGYSKMREQLDNFLHANYCALKLYPAQAPGPTSMDEKTFEQVSKWKNILITFLVSCLIVARYYLAPECKEQAEIFLSKLI